MIEGTCYSLNVSLAIYVLLLVMKITKVDITNFTIEFLWIVLQVKNKKKTSSLVHACSHKNHNSNFQQCGAGLKTKKIKYFTYSCVTKEIIAYFHIYFNAKYGKFIPYFYYENNTGK